MLTRGNSSKKTLGTQEGKKAVCQGCSKHEGKPHTSPWQGKGPLTALCSQHFLPAEVSVLTSFGFVSF